VTEAEWLNGADPQAMLEHVRGTASHRKLRLFAAACCRQVWRFLGHEDSRQGVIVAERYADGLASERERQAAAAAIPRCYSYGDEDPTDPGNVDTFATEAVACALFADNDCPPITTYATTCAIAAAHASANAAAYAASVSVAGNQDAAARVADRVYAAALRQRVSLVRDLFGNPFRAVAFDAVWLTPEVVRLARAAYDERAFDQMPDLAEALDRAGCTHQEIQRHCRQPGEHVRGCWVVDLILGQQ